MDRRKLSRLVRVLGLLGSDSDGERASAALAAERLRAELKMSWAELLLPPPGTNSRGRIPYDVDERAAAEARMRQLKAINDRLESQNRALRRRLAATATAERRRQEAEDED
jgi:hypothetical protein